MPNGGSLCWFLEQSSDSQLEPKARLQRPVRELVTVGSSIAVGVRILGIDAEARRAELALRARAHRWLARAWPERRMRMARRRSRDRPPHVNVHDAVHQLKALERIVGAGVVADRKPWSSSGKTCRRPLASELSPVHVAPVPDLHDRDELNFVLYRVQDAIRALPEPVLFLSG